MTFQTTQRLSEWRNAIGSSGLVILEAFFDAAPSLKNSNAERRRFSKYYLENMRFLYRDFQGKNRNVSYRLVRGTTRLNFFVSGI